MKLTERNRGMSEVLSLASVAPASAPPPLQRPVSDLVARNRSRWEEAAVGAEDAVEQGTARLKDYLNRYGNYQAANYLTGKNWVKPREGRPGTLYVGCDPRLLPRQWRDAASAALGFDVRLETRA
jgi:hypothetical protein